MSAVEIDYTPASVSHETREGWLEAAVELLAPAIECLCGDSKAGVFGREYEGKKLPPLRVSCGFPSKGGISAKKRTVGEAWTPDAETPQVFISPTLDDPFDVLATLVHELVHVAVGNKAGHGPLFRRVALGVGLTGPMRSTVAGPDLLLSLKRYAAMLGPYPHTALKVRPRGSVGSRLLKAQCEACGAIIRITQKVCEAPGLPYCACGGEGEEEGEPARFTLAE